MNLNFSYLMAGTETMLNTAAVLGHPITYGAIIKILHTDRLTLARLLGAIQEKDAENEYPLRSALVVGKKSGLPGQGFFECACAVDKMKKGEDQMGFWKSELKKVFDFYRC